MEALGIRKGEVRDMMPDGKGRVRLEYIIPSRGLIGFRGEFMTMTSGTGLLYSSFDHYDDIKPGEIGQRKNGVLISNATGKALAYALFGLQERGKLMIEANVEVYEGQIIGIHSRTNFDLSQHEKFSGKNIKYFDPETNESYTPYVIETSIGVDRMFLSIMSASYCEEKLENGETRVVLKLPAALAPVKLAVMPLVKKDGLPEKAREIIDNLKFHFHCQYDEKDSIGKRYRRQDAIGTPYCVTVDHQTLEDNCVTLRNRDTMQQERVAISELNNIIADRVSITSLLKTLQ